MEKRGDPVVVGRHGRGLATLHDLPSILDIPITRLCVPGVRGAQHQGEVDGGAAES